MTDLEITKLCAKAMRLDFGHKGLTIEDMQSGSYNPLENDAQAMALVKKFHLWCGYDDTDNGWKVRPWPYIHEGHSGLNFNLNRAICECVAKMQAAK